MMKSIYMKYNNVIIYLS